MDQPSKPPTDSPHLVGRDLKELGTVHVLQRRPGHQEHAEQMNLADPGMTRLENMGNMMENVEKQLKHMATTLSVNLIIYPIYW